MHIKETNMHNTKLDIINVAADVNCHNILSNQWVHYQMIWVCCQN